MTAYLQQIQYPSSGMAQVVRQCTEQLQKSPTAPVILRLNASSRTGQEAALGYKPISEYSDDFVRGEQ